MAKVKIVPKEDYDILREYLGVGDGLVLVPEEVLEKMPEKAQEKWRELEGMPYVEYDFGGEPDAIIDLVLNKDSYAYGILAQQAEEEGTS